MSYTNDQKEEMNASAEDNMPKIEIIDELLIIMQDLMMVALTVTSPLYQSVTDDVIVVR